MYSSIRLREGDSTGPTRRRERIQDLLADNFCLVFYLSSLSDRSLWSLSECDGFDSAS